MYVTAGLVRASCPQRIAKVHDQYLSFMALEARLFSLGLPDTYLQLNDPKAQDTQIQVCSPLLCAWKHSTLMCVLSKTLCQRQERQMLAASCWESQ